MREAGSRGTGSPSRASVRLACASTSGALWRSYFFLRKPVPPKGSCIDAAILPFLALWTKMRSPLRHPDFLEDGPAALALLAFAAVDVQVRHVLAFLAVQVDKIVRRSPLPRDRILHRLDRSLIDAFQLRF